MNSLNSYENAAAAWKGYNIKSASDIDKYLDSFRIMFAYNSGKIENPEITYHDTREIFENGEVKGFSGNPTALFEQQNQKMCYEFLKDKIISKKPLDIELIKEIHKILMSGAYDKRRYIENNERPGEFKKHDYVIGINEVGIEPAEVENSIRELLEEIEEVSEASAKNILLAAAYFHAKLEYIHPFADGNGRVGRTLLNYYLMTRNHPPLVIYDEDKTAYYKALEKYDTDEEIKPLYEFLKGQLCKTWTKGVSSHYSTHPQKERHINA